MATSKPTVHRENGWSDGARTRMTRLKGPVLNRFSYAPIETGGSGEDRTRDSDIKSVVLY